MVEKETTDKNAQEEPGSPPAPVNGMPASQTTEEPAHGEPTTRSWPMAIALVLLGVGVGLALYLVYVKLRLGYDPTFKSVCSFGGRFDCGEVQTHPASEMFGIPIALYALPTYLTLAWLVLRAWRGQVKEAASYVVAIGTLTCLHTLYLAYISSAVIGYYCPFCMGMYAVNIGVTVLATIGRGAGFAGAWREAIDALRTLRGPVGSSAIVLLISGGVAWGWYDTTRGDMAELEKARVAAEQAEFMNLQEEETAPTSAEPAVTGSRAVAQNPRRPARKPKAVLTDNGLSYFEIPVAEDDPVLGPADAPVTLVAIKDFECSYCRFVTYQTKPLKQKHKDSVRFVFKNYPMNSDCNYRMGTTRMHEGACRSAFTGVCAQEQGKFWEMHDVLYQNQKKFSYDQLRGYAEKVGLDLAAYDACMASDRPKEKVERDVRLAGRMRINGTPRLYINNRAVTGSVATDVLEYYITLAKEAGGAVEAAEPETVTDASPRMVKMTRADGEFWIDAFENSIGGKGEALSVPGVRPAYASWFDADAACKQAGKRMCTEEEWISACIGEPAVDHRKNGNFNQGPVVGRLYPYGPFYQKGACRDSEDKYSGQPGATGTLPACRTTEGIYDLSGNLYEWVGDSPQEAAMMGGDYRGGSAGTCRRKATTYGAGIKNNTLGFRCCSDGEVTVAQGAGKLRDTAIADVVGKKVPSDLVLKTRGGGTLTPSSFRGKVTYLTFFASWCGNCRKQMPAIKEWQTEWGNRGFQVVGIDVDRTEAKAEKYISELDPNFTVAFDPTARTMSDFDINAMPTSFIVDRTGKIKRRVVGYKDEEIAGTRQAIVDLL